MIFDKYVRALTTTSNGQTNPMERTMIFNRHVRTLASASLLALAIVNMSTGFANAAWFTNRADCERNGFKWYDGYGCNDSACYHDGKFYNHGEGYSEDGYLYVCSGFTGQFIRARTAQPQGPTAPASTTTGTNAPPSRAPANPLTAPTTGTYSQPTQPTPTPVVRRTTGTYTQR